MARREIVDERREAELGPDIVEAFHQGAPVLSKSEPIAPAVSSPHA